MEVFKQQVKKNWLPLEDSTDEFGTDAAHYISIGFDYAHEQGMSADDAFEQFKDHYRDAPGSYDEVTRQLVRNTAAAITAAFSGKNKAELVGSHGWRPCSHITEPRGRSPLPSRRADRGQQVVGRAEHDVTPTLVEGDPLQAVFDLVLLLFVP
ncbi:MAG: hypothetical protein IPL77_19895 [Flavobacteriales bacterium]|nr:hypothetical protein [Flavobacteriales bacterium]